MILKNIMLNKKSDTIKNILCNITLYVNCLMTTTSDKEGATLSDREGLPLLPREAQ